MSRPLTAVTQSSTDSSNKIATTNFVAIAIANAIAGVNPAVAVKYATTAAGDTSGLTYNNGTSGVGATLTGVNNTVTTIDGHAFIAGDVGVTRVLIKNDTQSPSGAFNGVYLFTALHTAITGDVFTRATDYNSISAINDTGAIPVAGGTVNISTSWLLTSAVTTLGTDPLTYAQFSVNPTSIVISGGALGTPSSGNLANCTLPTLNQNTSGSAASLSVSGQAGLITVSGITSTSRNKVVRDADDTILELGGSYTPTGTWSSMTLATPALGTPVSGNLSNCTFPTLNQNTSGSAATATSATKAASVSISGQAGLLSFTGITASNHAKTVRDADDTILELAGSYTPTGTWTNMTLVTPALGTPASGVGTNITGITAAHVVAGSFGTGAYTMDTKLTVPLVINTNNVVTVTANAGTVPVTSELSTFTNNSAGAMTITIATAGAVDGQNLYVRVYDASAVSKAITWVNTENGEGTAPTTSNGSTTLPKTVHFMFNSATSKWRCIP